MTRATHFGYAILCTLLLAACGTQAPLETRQVAQAPLLAALVAGVTTKAQVLERFGPTTRQVFGDGREVWLYHDGSAELVILFGPDGVVSKTRRSLPASFQ